MDFAIIFDMDGVIVESMPYHIEAWRLFCSKYDFKLAEKELRELLHGKTTRSILQNLFGKDISEEEIKQYTAEKGDFYRGLASEKIQPVRGVDAFLDRLKENNIPIAIGTSATPENVSFVMDELRLKDYFHAVVDSSQVSRSKPDPEVFLKAAEKLRIEPSRCIVFEDALAGVEAARRAGMKVIALATTHPKEELNKADLVIEDFSEMNIEKIKRFLKQS